MSLLAMLAAGAAPVTPPPDPVDIDDAIPYAIPTTAPYNVPTFVSLPPGQAVHPCVLDFGTQFGNPGTWNGYRMWMAITPYPYGASGAENPFILCSHDGVTWATPAGLTNPIDPPPGASGYNSDTELTYDPATGRLWCMWREHNHGADPDEYTLHTAWSTTGSAWTKVENVLTTTALTGDVLSPSLALVAPGQWRMVTIAGRVWSATSPAGPWTYLHPASFTWSGTSQNVWHFGMALVDGVLYGLVDSSSPSQGIFAATSADGGATWAAAGATPLIAPGSGGWDHVPYRATLTPHENGTHFRVWYSANGVSDGTGQPWRTGFTHVPMSAWPAPPA